MKRLRIKVYTQILKTENGSVGTVSRMLKLDDYIKHPVKKTKEGEEKVNNKNVQLRLIKGLKGWLRHKYMEYYLSKEIEVCYSSAKENFKDRKVEIPKGFHLLGACDGKCPIYEIFGGVITKKGGSSEMSKSSKISVWANPMISEKRFNSQSVEVREKLKERFNVMTFNIENGIALGNDECLQNFGKEFISGEFDIFIDVSKLNDEEFKTLLEVVLTTNIQLGGSKTNGNGKIEIKKMFYENITEKIDLSDSGSIDRREEVELLSLPKLENLAVV